MRYTPHKEQEKLTTEERAYNRLRQRKEDKPYYQRYYAIYILIIILGWSANLLSGLTESSKLYAFYYAFLSSFSLAKLITWFLVLLSVLLLEVLHRLIASSYFKDLVENDIHSREMTPKLVAMLSIAVISVMLSFSGSFDLVRLTNEAPTLLVADKISVNDLTKAYQPLVSDVKSDIQDFRKTREWKGRLSDNSAKKWEKMKSNKQEIQLQQAEALKNLSSLNLETEIRIDSLNHNRQQFHEEQIEQKGFGLGFISIIAIFVLYACLWYDEEYQERKALYLEKKFGAINAPLPSSYLETPIPPSGSFKNNSQLPPYRTETPPPSSGEKNGVYGGKNSASNPIGFFMNTGIGENTDYMKPPVQTCTRLYREKNNDSSTQKVIDDRYTVEHYYQKSGEKITVRYNILMINSRIGQYEREIKQARVQNMDDAVLQNRQNWLTYWQRKKAELLQKMPKNE